MASVTVFGFIDQHTESTSARSQSVRNKVALIFDLRSTNRHLTCALLRVASRFRESRGMPSSPKGTALAVIVDTLVLAVAVVPSAKVAFRVNVDPGV